MRHLSGKWDFRPDPQNQGTRKRWFRGFTKDRAITIPASWNEQYKDLRDYLGPAWYQTRFDWPGSHQNKGIFIRFGSVNYLAQVWLNGFKLGQHEGGHLPFVLEVTRLIKKKGNLLVVRAEGFLKPDRVPPGNVPPGPLDSFNNNFNPPASFDFFPFCGIQRPVILFSVPNESIQDVTVTTEISGNTGLVQVKSLATNAKDSALRVSLEGFGFKATREVPIQSGGCTAFLKIPKAKFWAPSSPHLYQLKVELRRADKTIDQIKLLVGIRTIKINKNKILLNGKPIFLKGFGRHEDFPGKGRNLPPSALAKDYRNMRWVGANSFRTTHYPYSDEDMAMADRLGFLVIDETPAVGLFFKKEGLARRLKLCRQFTKEMIDRDKNHPSVVMWSLANEPHSKRAAAQGFFKNLAQLARSLDQTRPVTLVSYLGTSENSFRFLDLVCVNRYFGWYTEPGDLDKAIPRLSRDLDAIHRKFKKPLLVTEFGADAIPGSHANPPIMFSEEYQEAMISRYIELMNKKPYIAGTHVWNLCDFRTAQATHRPNSMNYKGVFTRDRRPKLAAHLLRRLWKTKRGNR